jgi:type I restriction enzyme S subunit
MAKTVEARVTPRLRFPGFRNSGAWETTTLGAIATILKGKGVAKSDVVSDGLLPCIRYGELYTRYVEVIDAVYSRTNVPISELFLSRKHDVLIPASGETKLDIATAACVLHDGIAIGSDLNVLRARRNGNGVFLSYLLNSSKRKEIARVAQGDTVVHLYPSQLQNLVVPLPDPSEQQKIADCLMSLDAVIAAQARKVEALKAHKQGLMQQLFPGEGETVPRLRFPEFLGATEWKEFKAGKLFANRTDRGDIALPIYSVTMHDGMVRRSSFDRDFGDIEDPAGNRKAIKGDITYNTMRMWQGALGVAVEDCLVSPAYVVLAPGDGVVSQFFAYLFKLPSSLQLLTSHSRGLTKDRLRLYYDDFATITLRCPTPAEQQRIADCLSSIDADIATAVTLLDALTSHKAGLMQQLFPLPEVD